MHCGTCLVDRSRNIWPEWSAVGRLSIRDYMRISMYSYLKPSPFLWIHVCRKWSFLRVGVGCIAPSLTSSAARKVAKNATNHHRNHISGSYCCCRSLFSRVLFLASLVIRGMMTLELEHLLDLKLVLGPICGVPIMPY